MDVIRPMSVREMVHRFAIGEVRSKFFPDGFDRDQVERLLLSGDTDDQDQGMAVVRMVRWNIFTSLPHTVRWHLAELEITQDSLDDARTTNDPGWIELTGGSRRLADATLALKSGIRSDARVAAIIARCRQGPLELRGITLLAASASGQFEIVEGHGRLAALHTCWALEQNDTKKPPKVEVALGITSP